MNCKDYPPPLHIFRSLIAEHDVARLPLGPVKAQTKSEPICLLNLSASELRESLAQRCGSEPPDYRVNQILEWVYTHKVSSFDEMTNLPAELRRQLSSSYATLQSEVAQQQNSSDGTRKLLLRWPEGGTSECVLIPGKDRMTACISTQVGCAVKCVFCASGIDGLERNLSAGQMVEQALRLSALSEELGRRLSNVVFMGLGEPLANYDAALRALHNINASWGLGIGARKITISTVGLPSQMKRLAHENLQITLALSLHAPTDELRQQLIPWARRVTIDELVDACCYYFDRTSREVTLEYILLDGVNNLPSHAEQLAAVSTRMRSNVNLIPFNEVADLHFKRPSDESTSRFAASLRRCGVNCHVRRSRGGDIDAACGQLRRRVSTS